MKHSIRRTVLSVLGGLLLAFASAITDARAAAAMLCGPRNDVAEDLAKNHGELPVSWGLIGSSHLIEVFVSPTGGFTIIVEDSTSPSMARSRAAGMLAIIGGSEGG